METPYTPRPHGREKTLRGAEKVDRENIAESPYGKFERDGKRQAGKAESLCASAPESGILAYRIGREPESRNKIPVRLGAFLQKKVGKKIKTSQNLPAKMFLRRTIERLWRTKFFLTKSDLFTRKRSAQSKQKSPQIAGFNKIQTC